MFYKKILVLFAFFVIVNSYSNIFAESIEWPIYIYGTVEPTIVSFQVPVEVSFAINPNINNGLVSSDIKIKNLSTAPLDVGIKNFKYSGGLLNNPVKMTDYTDEQWVSMGVKDSVSKISLSLSRNKISAWNLSTEEVYEASDDNLIKNMGVLSPNQETILSISGKYGRSFSISITSTYRITFIFGLSDYILPAGVYWEPQMIGKTSNNFNSVTYGNGIFVAVTTNGGVMTSIDGIDWVTRTPAVNNIWTSVTFGDGLFVAISNTGVGNRVMTSLDGINWTPRTSAADNQWTSVTYGNGLFVAVSNAGVMTSHDGINWTSRTSAANNWTSVTYGNGLFVAVSNAAGNKVMTSEDGVNWISRVSIDGSWVSVTYGNGLFIATANSGKGGIKIMKSTDGINWTLVQTTFADALYSVTYGNGIFVAVGTTVIFTSKDGVNWLKRLQPAMYCKSVVYGNGLFVTVGNPTIYTGTWRIITSGKINN